MRYSLVNILEQDKIWRSRDGVVVKLDEMTPSHRKNTLAFLRRDPAYQRMFYYRILDRIMSTAPDGAWEQYLDERSRALVDDAESWLERRPLIKKLAALVHEDEHPIIDGEVVVKEVEAVRKELLP